MVSVENLRHEVVCGLDGDKIIKHIELCARTCYKSEDKIGDGTAAKLVRKLVSLGHGAMLEHWSVTVRFVCDRGVSHELVRHRLASYAQESTRYCNYGGGKFGGEIKVIPMLEGLTSEQIERRMSLYRYMESVYIDEIAEGVKPQQARDNLPTCLKTEIVVTANLREWRHIFRLRTSSKAHPQIRVLLEPLLHEMRREIQIIFDDI
jgi:thymidylate synthase (FAD)